MPTNLILVLAGTTCLALCALLVYKTLPRAGRPESSWTRTETRATAIAMSVLVLFFLGLTMFVKGIL